MNLLKKQVDFPKAFLYCFLLVSILLVVYIFYRSEIVSQGQLHDKYSLYYAVSLMSVVFWFSVLKSSHKMRLNVVLVILSSLTSLYLIEAFLYYSSKSAERYKIEELVDTAYEKGVNYDFREKYQVISDMKKVGVSALPQLHPSYILNSSEFYDLFPLGGVSNKIIVDSNESGSYMIFENDRHGFNNPDGEWDRNIDWALIGDSFTQGVAVSPGNEISGQIRKLTGESVINLGKSGNGPLSELGALKEYLPKIKPKNVIWIYYEGNDLNSDLINEKKNNILIQYLNKDFSQNLVQRQTEIDNKIEKQIFIEKSKSGRRVIINALLLSNIRSILNQALSYQPNQMNQNNNLILLKNILKEADLEVSKWGGVLYFVYLPESQRYSTHINHDVYQNKENVLNIVSDLGISAIDLHKDLFLNYPDISVLFPLGIPKNHHFNKYGYNAVSNVIVSHVKNIAKTPIKDQVTKGVVD